MMANPQLENGYTQIANEILEAMAKINLSPYEGRALFFLIRKTYGWKKKTDWISLSQFSKGLGLDRRHVFRSLKGLQDKGLVVICRDDKKHPRYGFQKDYMKWEMKDFNKNVLAELKLKRKRERKSACTDDKVSPLLAPTKETLTKETLKEREKEKLAQNPFSLSKEEDQNPKAPKKKVYLPDAALTDSERQERYRRREEAKEKGHRDLELLLAQENQNEVKHEEAIS